MTGLIEVRGGAVDVGGRRLWSGLDLVVGDGEFVALLGPNGAGKSTLIRMLLGMVPLREGSALVSGAAPGAAAGTIGYLPQRRRFDPDLRIRGRELVRLGLDGHKWGLPIRPDRGAAARVQEVIDLVDAAGFADLSIGELSGGEQQRILIAQALVRSPRLLLLDEPLDSLDLPNQAGIAALLSRLAREQRVAIVMVAHDVNPILQFLDSVVYLAGGRAVVGAPEDVIDGPTLSRLYGTPIEVLRARDGSLVVVGAPEPPAHHSDRHHTDGHHHEYDRDPRRPHEH